ncbi:MAG: hypothetical protein Rubg2KO_16260 [Rubricoccaceae bacterium]
MNTNQKLGPRVAMLLIAGLLLVLPDPASAQARRGNDRPRVVRELPRDNVAIRVGARPYHYSGGVFYRRSGPGYVVVAAPRGAVVRTLPRAYVTLRIGSRTYYRFGTVFYVRVDGGYQVVTPPPGGTVDMLPVGYETVYVDGEAFYVHEGVWYRYDPGRDVYVTVEEP